MIGILPNSPSLSYSDLEITRLPSSIAAAAFARMSEDFAKKMNWVRFISGIPGVWG